MSNYFASYSAVNCPTCAPASLFIHLKFRSKMIVKSPKTQINADGIGSSIVAIIGAQKDKSLEAE